MLTFACVEVGALWLRVQESAAGLDRVFFLMDLPGESGSAAARARSRRSREAVRIEGASYAYPDGSVALRDVELEARVGQVVALVGPAGAGKTTLAYLIPRFLAPTTGRVLLRRRRHRRRRRSPRCATQVAFVFQETVLFDATIEENIRARPARRERSRACARAAQLAGADDFVRRLPEGYRDARSAARAASSRSGRSSASRSRARSCATRAILILDEPTSALDPETEQRARRVAARGEPRPGRARDRAPPLDGAQRGPDPVPRRRARSSSAAATTS